MKSARLLSPFRRLIKKWKAWKARYTIARNELTAIIKNWIIVYCNSRVLIGWAAMVYEPLYHAQEVATINCFLVALENEISKAYQYYLIVFNKTIIPLALVGYEMIIANSALRASLAIYHLISDVRSWNNC